MPDERGSGSVPPAASPSNWQDARTDWRQRRPWLLLVRALRIALEVRMLLPAAGGVLLTVFGWWLLAWIFGGADDPLLRSSLPGYRSCPFKASSKVVAPSISGTLTINAASTEPISTPVITVDRGTLTIGPDTLTNLALSTESVPLNPGTLTSAPLARPPDINAMFFGPPELGRYPRVPFVEAWRQLSGPVRQLFDRDVTFVSLAFLLLAALWAVAVWALVGGALTRMAAVQLTREEKISWRQAFGHAATKWQAYFSAPLMPLLGVLLMAVPMALVGLLARTNAGLLVVGLLWPLYLLAGLLMTIFLVGLMFGWPLMWAAIGTESSDSFDALSRAYSYVYQRALRYLFYAVVATLLSILGGAVVSLFASWVIYLAHWSSAWGSGGGMANGELTTLGQWGGHLLRFWDGVVRLLALGFVYSYLWTASTAIYLLLRHDVDGTEMDEVFIDDADEYGMPPLKTDAAGVPDVADEPGSPGPTPSPPAD